RRMVNGQPIRLVARKAERADVFELTLGAISGAHDSQFRGRGRGIRARGAAGTTSAWATATATGSRGAGIYKEGGPAAVSGQSERGSAAAKSATPATTG